MVETSPGVMQSKEYAVDEKTEPLSLGFSSATTSSVTLACHLTSLRSLFCISKASECESLLRSFSALI